MTDETNDRRELDKLREKLEEERFASLKALIESKMDALTDKIGVFTKQLDEHLKVPHNLAQLAVAAAPVMDPPRLRFQERGGILGLLLRYWIHIFAGLGAATGSAGLLIRGCDGYAVHVHTPEMATADAASATATPTPTHIRHKQPSGGSAQGG